VKLFVIVLVSADELADMKRRLDRCYAETNLHADNTQHNVNRVDSQIHQVCLLHGLTQTG